MSFDVIGAQSDDGTALVVYYSEPPGTGADDAANYAITGGFSVSGVGVVAGNTATFAAAGGTANGTSYVLTVTGVVSAGSSEPLTNGTATFSLPVAVDAVTPVSISGVVAAAVNVDALPAATITGVTAGGTPVDTVPPAAITTVSAGGTDVFVIPVGGSPPPPPVTIYRMRAYATPIAAVIQWDAVGAPDPTGAQSPYPGQVTGAVVLRVTTTP